MFISFLYMFRVTVYPSSGETTVSMCHLVLVTVLYVGWNETPHTRQSSTHSDKYQVSHRYSCFSWWWAHSHPKHVEKRNKHTKKNCAPHWLLFTSHIYSLFPYSYRKTGINLICWISALWLCCVMCSVLKHYFHLLFIPHR